MASGLATTVAVTLAFTLTNLLIERLFSCQMNTATHLILREQGRIIKLRVNNRY